MTDTKLETFEHAGEIVRVPAVTEYQSHGDRLRDDAMDSSNVENQDPPKLTRNQWGGTLGGPIQRDRAFFFASYERLDETRGVNIDQSKIPAFIVNGLATPGGVETYSASVALYGMRFT